MKLRILPTLFCLLTLLLSASAFAQTLPPQKDAALPDELDHKLIEFKKSKLKLADFAYETLDGQKINLRASAKDQKAVLIVYFAAWCENSAHDADTINALYRAYRDKGLAIIGVCNYSSRDELKTFIAKHKVEYPVCLESEANNDKEIYASRETTTHYKYRKEAGDSRKWGTPFSLLINTKDIKDSGNVIADKLHVAAGELKQDDADKLIRQHLKLR